jgi:hypothetical protein
VISDSEGAAERIIDLEAKLARAPAKGAQRRDLMKAIGLEADKYRKALDGEQAAEQFDKGARIGR